MVRAIVGANWGDEGKGKITDMLAEKSDIIIRFQGGSNAGHTIINNYGRFALHLLPSGIFYGHTTCILGNGVALDIPALIREMDDVVSQAKLQQFRQNMELMLPEEMRANVKTIRVPKAADSALRDFPAGLSEGRLGAFARQVAEAENDV